MRKLLSLAHLLLFFVLVSPLCAQFPCGSDPMWQQLQAADPHAAERQRQLDQQIAEIMAHGDVQRIGTISTIPVVVHIVHNGGPENISNLMVLQGIADLNAAFANTGAYDSLTGVNTEIQFCLASQDPTGAGTTGINRVQNALTNVVMETQDQALKNLIIWDPTKYLNVWLVAEINSQAYGPNVAGYAYLPSSHGTSHDGIVCEARWFGSTPDNSKVMVHEAGHYLGLYHTFEGGCANSDCLADGDKVCDTPPDGSTAPSNCSTPPNTCATDDDDLSGNNPFRPISSGGLGDQPDMLMNYMDYGDHACQSAFSQGQKTRMTLALTTTRASLLTSLGCNSPCANPIVAAFNPNPTQALVGQSVAMGSTTTGASTYLWQKNGLTFSTAPNPSHGFTAAGVYEIVLTASNGDPSCTEYAIDTVYISCLQNASFTASASNVAPGTTVTFTNTSSGPGTSFQWLLDGVPASSATNWSYTFNTVGGHTISLVQYGTNCNDTSLTQFVAVGACNSLRYNRWYFGAHAGVSFATGAPMPLFDAAQIFSGFESVTTMCDPLGNLLFYTNGEQVWNRSHTVMPNGSGMRANQSSTQGALAVPKPGSAKDYYLFTMPIPVVAPYDSNLYVSTIDMNLAGGMGDVVVKCDTLMRRPTEKLTSTNHCNGRDVWVVAHQYQSDAFYSYLVTPTGLQPPVVTHVGSAHVGNFELAQGAMKISPDGRRLALVTNESFMGRVEIFDFDNSTGRPSNPILITSALIGHGYGLEFSPDSKRLYFANSGDGGSRPAELYQFDLDAGSPTAVINSMTLIATNADSPWGALQLAPDGKIYLSRRTRSQFGAINVPNALGAACNFVMVGPNIGYNASYGLHNINTSLFSTTYPEITGPDTVCAFQQGVVFQRSANSCSGGGTVTWSVSGNAQLMSSTDTSATLQFTGPGAASLTILETAPCGSGTDQVSIFIRPSGPTVWLGPDQSLCPGASLTLDAGAGYASYLWTTGASTQTIQVTGPGVYGVQVGGGSTCDPNDSIVVTQSANALTVNLGPDQTMCDGQVLGLNAGPGYTSYLWQDGSDLATHTAWQPGTYWVSVTGAACAGTVSDTIQIWPGGGAQVDLGNDTVICPGGLLILQGNLPNASYSWSDGSGGASMPVTQPGTYWVQAIDSNGCAGSDTIVVGLCVGLENGIGIPQVRVWPNPATTMLYFEVNGLADGLQVSLWDMAGRVVHRQALGTAQAGRISVADLASGLYLLHVEGSGWMRNMLVEKQ